MILLAGGSEAIVERERPGLLAMGGALHHVDPRGSGTWLKLAVNALFASQVVAMAEQLALLRCAGVDAERALVALRAMPVKSPSAAGAAALMLASNFTPQAPVDLIAKDIGCVLALSNQALPLMQQVAARFAAALPAKGLRWQAMTRVNGSPVITFSEDGQEPRVLLDTGTSAFGFLSTARLSAAIASGELERTLQVPSFGRTLQVQAVRTRAVFRAFGETLPRPVVHAFADVDVEAPLTSAGLQGLLGLRVFGSGQLVFDFKGERIGYARRSDPR